MLITSLGLTYFRWLYGSYVLVWLLISLVIGMS